MEIGEEWRIERESERERERERERKSERERDIRGRLEAGQRKTIKKQFQM